MIFRLVDRVIIKLNFFSKLELVSININIDSVLRICERKR